MATESEKTIPSNIPPEIIEIILSKLSSVKSLLRFKTVSKSWNTIISDPLFIQNHLDCSNNSPDNNLFISSYTCGSDSRGFPMVDFEVRKSDAGKISEENIPNGYNSILCECNGVLLLSNLFDVKYGLWNPSIRCEMFLIYKYEFKEDYIVDYGICYDQITSDFKVVFIFPTKYAIYSCNNNSWTKKNLGTSYHTIGGTAGSGLGIFVDGATYWILRDNMISIHLVYFDPRTDEIKRLQKPEQRQSDDDKFQLMNIASLRGRLCLYFYNKKERIAQIWMKEKGIDKWKEFITFHNFEAPYKLSRPICLVENKVVIQKEENIFVYYNTSTDKSVKKEFVHIYGDRRKLVPYRNSLYFPTGVGTKKIKAQQSRLLFT
ncbi:PREDICTED: putative F-box protein At1g47390 [Erythranthe guttata]|uniref:putative F-box protein At1g47390 n=1 Tax=Erythranthe guttata TaxID=4155 RepID=UPI00064D9989|nr:PREDICTED: putative F-box protein At1g47390 [Erythranthe guttata]|eukprot:XP_012844470.1 PREDICTED: putative F-box protein At1g47390 [Erythranthe guttata]